MKKKEYTDITERIAQKLKAHREPYREGAWEDFLKGQKPAKKPLWPWLSAAATLLLVGSFLLLNNKQEDLQGDPAVAVLPQSKTPAADHPMESEREDKGLQRPGSATILPETEVGSPQIQASRIADKKEVEVAVYQHQKAEMHGLQGVHQGYATSQQHPRTLPQTQAIAQVNVTRPVEETTDKVETENAAEVASIESLSSIKPIDPPLPVQKAGSAWGFAVNVAPVMSADDINMGGGIEVSYQLSKNISLRTGVSYMELDAHRNIGQNKQALMMDAPSGANALFSPSKVLNSVNTSVSGLDIPIHMEYKINARFFASAGVSVFNVLKENRIHHYRSQVQELSSFSGNKGIAASPKPVVKTVYSSEKATQTPYESSNFTGFVDFSVGYQLPVLQNLHLSVEPFYKIPVKARSMQDMDLTSGGLRISAGF